MRKLSLVLFTVLLLTGCNQQQTGSVSEGATLKTFLASSSKPVVLKFYASWCSSCKQYAPAFKEVQESQSEIVDFFEIDVDSDQSKALIKELKISRIPETILITADRATITRKLGALSVNELTSLVEELKAKP